MHILLPRVAPRSTTSTTVGTWQQSAPASLPQQKPSLLQRRCTMSHIKKSVRVFLLVVTISLLGACHGFSGAGANKSSLVEFLYPNSTGYVETPEIPHLQLPLRVGI